MKNMYNYFKIKLHWLLTMNFWSKKIWVLLVVSNGRKLSDSYCIPFQIIYNDSICGVVWNNKLLFEFFFFETRRQFLIKDFWMVKIEPYFHKSLKFFFPSIFFFLICIFWNLYLGSYYHGLKFFSSMNFITI